MISTSRSVALLSAALVPLLLACGDAPPSRTSDSATAAATAEPPRDTATLTPESMQLSGIVLATADSLPWRDAWSVPARVILDPSATQSLGAIAEGRVARVFARVGDVVAAGQVLVAIHSHEMMELQSDMAKAVAAANETEAALGVATSASARAERLHALRALALAELERARGELAQARSRHEQARAELQRVRSAHAHLRGTGPTPASIDEHEVLVRAPAAGTVAFVEARPGAVVLVGAPLITITRTSSLLLALDLPERAIGATAPGAPVRFTVPALPSEHFDARIVRVGPVLDSITRTVSLQASIARGVSKLRAGMYASADLLGPELARALVVPGAAVQSFEGDTVVITARAVAGGTQLEVVRVRVGRRSSERAEILAGLPRGARVVADGAAIAKAEILRRRAED